MSESEENSTVFTTHKIERAFLISYIKGFANDQAQAPFINPNMCMKIIDFVYVLKDRTGVSVDVSHKSTILFLFISFSIIDSESIAWAAQGQCFRGSNNFLSLLQVFLGEAISSYCFPSPIGRAAYDQLVHNWYKIPIQDKPIPAFKDRTKTIDEVIHHLTAVCIFLCL